MIRAFYGLSQNPFSTEGLSLLKHQQEIYDTLRVHNQQGGLCLVLGSPGTGKTIIKEAIKQNADKRMLVVSVSRTLHMYSNTVKILCQAFNIEYAGSDFKCEKRLIEEAFTLNCQGKSLVTIIDDAHLMEMNTLSPHISWLVSDEPHRAGYPDDKIKS
jgi:type II secretory pathway predicted ATPase ExeA